MKMENLFPGWLLLQKQSKISCLKKKIKKNKYSKKIQKRLVQSPFITPISLSPKKNSFPIIKKTNTEPICTGSFQEAIGSILLLGQFFAVMPVRGVKSKNVDDLKFTWKSIRTIYSVIMFIMVLAYSILAIIWLFDGKIEFIRIVPVIFNGSNAFGIYCFGRLAISWPELMKQWDTVENQLPKYETIKERSKLKFKVKVMSIVILSISTIEHLLKLTSDYYATTLCKVERNHFEALLRNQLVQLFYFTTYSDFKAIIGKLLNIICTFVWSFMDLFVMLISVGLSSKFKQINDYLMKHKGQALPDKFWIEQRLCYRNVCKLCDYVDGKIAQITFVSFSNNLYFICVQLLWSINPMTSFYHATYFWFSLIFLLSRTLAVCMLSSNIHEESKVPIKIFRSVPMNSWCAEVKRFSKEVYVDFVALSGMRFFYLTRSLVLSVAGVIVTYELVLIQFHKGDRMYGVVNC